MIPSGLQEGQKVEHQKFGFGEVIKMEGSAHNPIATVKFQVNGEKKLLMLNYAKLRIELNNWFKIQEARNTCLFSSTFLIVTI